MKQRRHRLEAGGVDRVEGIDIAECGSWVTAAPGPTVTVLEIGLLGLEAGRPLCSIPNKHHYKVTKTSICTRTLQGVSIYSPLAVKGCPLTTP